MSLTSRLNALLTYANNATGEADTNLGQAVRTLVDGYGQGGGESFVYGGTNPVLVDSNHTRWTIADTSFVVGQTNSTSNVTIKTAVTNAYTSPTINFGDKDIIVVQKFKAAPIYSGASYPALLQGYEQVNITYNVRRKSKTALSKDYRTGISYAVNALRYKDSSNVSNYVFTTTYGLYCGMAIPATASVTANSTYVKCNSPSITSRGHNTYFSPANMVKMTECYFDWDVLVYTVDSDSTLLSKMTDILDTDIGG